jgi:hypothetical protein
MTRTQIEEVLAALGPGTHPGEVTVEHATGSREVQVVVRPKYSSRTFVLTATVSSAVEL